VSGTEGDPNDELSGEPALTISTHLDGSRAVVALSGELDLNGVPHLLDEVRQALAPDVEEVGIDLRDLRFIDSAGIQGVLSARQQIQDAGATFRVVGMSPTVARVVAMAGVESLLPSEDTTPS
jgi:anti-anti-sigma factor